MLSSQLRAKAAKQQLVCHRRAPPIRWGRAWAFTATAPRSRQLPSVSTPSKTDFYTICPCPAHGECIVTHA
eukprot:15476340-Alexandrium_andersonii.AAC.1